MKKNIRKIHLWIGLITGLVFFIVCVSGALLSFTEEALDIVNKDYIYVEKQDKPRAKVEDVIGNYERAYPNESFFIMNTYSEINRSFDFFSAVKSGKKNENGDDLYEGYKMVYANPYTSEIIRVDKGTLETIIILLRVHINLFLGEIGHYIIKIGTFIFLIQILAGLWLWFPRSKNAQRTAYKVKIDGSGKRLNYDLHRTLGFYVSGVLLVLTVTGLIMAWRFIKDPIVDSLGGKSELLETTPPQPRQQLNTADFSYNSLCEKLLLDRPSTKQITFFMPQSDTITVLSGRTSERASFLNFETGKYFQFNRYTGESTGGTNMEYYDRNNEIDAGILLIHMGFWGGTTTKILTFIFGLLGASLPITGFIIWFKRNKKKTK